MSTNGAAPQGAARSIFAREGALCALLVIVFYYPLLRFGYIQTGGDSANLFWPIKVVIQHAIWQDGVVPLWNPWSFLGAPLAASLQHAVFYPVDWLVYGLFPAHIGLNISNLLHLVLAGVGCYAWLRVGLRTTAATAIFLGAAFPCIGWFWGQQEHINQIAATSYLPLLTLVIWRFARNEMGWRAFVCIYSALSTFQFLTGHPQEAIYAQLFAGLLGLVCVVWRERRAAPLLRFAGGVAAAAILAGLLVSVQLLPTLELSHHSRRQFADPTYAISFSMPPDLLRAYIQPHAFGNFVEGYFTESGDWDRRAYGEYQLYVGWIVLLLAPAAFLRKRRLPLFLALIILATLIFAMGGNTDPARIAALQFNEQPAPGNSLYEWLLRIVPPLAGFRVPARVVVVTGFCWITLAALGLDALAERFSKRAYIQPAFGIAVWLSLFVPSLKEKFHYPADARPVIDYAESIDRTSEQSDGRTFRLTLSDDARLVAERHRDTTIADGNPIVNRGILLQPHMNALFGVPLVDGYEEGLVPTARYKDFLFEFNRNLRQAAPDPTLLALLGVQHIYTDLPIDARVYGEGETNELGWTKYENPNFRGLAFWESEVAGIDLARLDGPFYRGGIPHTGFQNEAVELGTRTPTNSSNKIVVKFPTVNRVDVSTAGRADKNALVALGWFPGWETESEGRSSHPLDFAGAIVARLPATSEPIWRLVFRPASYRVGLFLSALGAAIWCALLAFGWSARARNLDGEPRNALIARPASEPAGEAS